MSTGGVIALIVVVVLIGIPAVWMIVDNTRVLNEDKYLRAELAQIQKVFDAIPDGTGADDPRVVALHRRLADYGIRYEAWQRSPFVIQR